jgi:hypothetical protein
MYCREGNGKRESEAINMTPHPCRFDCESCPNAFKPFVHAVTCKKLGETTVHTDCMYHPEAREYLMRGVKEMHDSGNETIDKVRSHPAPCSFSCMKRTILESAQVSHSATSKPEEMYLVTKKELNLIKNDCAYPERQFCDGCEYADGEDNTRASGLGCNFEGANAVMDRVLSHPAPAAKQPINGCWYYDHNVCGLPHPSPTADKHDAAIRAEAKREERERVLKIAQHLADTIPDFNRMDYMHFLKESLRRGEP